MLNTDALVTVCKRVRWLINRVSNNAGMQVDGGQRDAADRDVSEPLKTRCKVKHRVLENLEAP